MATYQNQEKTMTVSVKMMSGEDAPDSDTRKCYLLITNVYNVKFARDPKTGKAEMELHFSKGYESVGDVEAPALYTETILLTGNVYVMNEDGKTISSFGEAPIPKKRRGE
jgi:hypothetical protein